MPEVIVRKGEPVDRALKRLKNKLDAEGILEEVRRLRAFETPSQKSRRKAKANAKRGRASRKVSCDQLVRPSRRCPALRTSPRIATLPSIAPPSVSSQRSR